MSVLFVAFLGLMLAAQVFVVTRVVRRAMAIGRKLRDPAQLRQMLSPETRGALRGGGFDPDELRIEQIQKSPELGRLVAADLRRLVGQGLLGAFRHETPAAFGQPEVPTPIGEPIGPSGSTLRVMAVFAVLALAVGAALVVQG